jgi:hypothetical protein
VTELTFGTSQEGLFGVSSFEADKSPKVEGSALPEPFPCEGHAVAVVKHPTRQCPEAKAGLCEETYVKSEMREKRLFFKGSIISEKLI